MTTSHSREARNPGRRDNGCGSYDANIERLMPSGHPQSTSQGKSTANGPLYSGGRPEVNTEEPSPSSNEGTGIPSQENENQPLTLLQPLYGFSDAWTDGLSHAGPYSDNRQQLLAAEV
ncbi:hypothetical protein ACJ73_06809 [Blastomyces percursus]|uniref:Uncharacterized protein n=1 Tax=Blastomyces percursus TaxID=1658174 RepID=A0A1J9QNR6_9EURO|nr:hypothetical protein ACJ73_06809 [Blastomyces percursus]